MVQAWAPKAMIEGRLRDKAGSAVVRVVKALPHSIIVELDVEPPDTETLWDDVELGAGERVIRLGRCRFYPHPSFPLRRASDPSPQPGHGRLVPESGVFDFRSLLSKGIVVPLAQRFQQLPLVLSRKASISSAFRAFANDVVYDLQVLRSLLDDIDRHLGDEPRVVAQRVREVATKTHWPQFCTLFDAKLKELETLAAAFTQKDNEVHGFYFRKQVWDMILCSSFLTRTNLKPRGYAGDSEMMRMVYADEFEGPTIFSRFMHRHPIASAAAQAVRNRRALLASLIAKAADRRGSETLSVMSVACGPARELRDVVTSPARARQLSFTLLDQDPEALAQAEWEAAEIGERIGTPVRLRAVRDSVRTMLRTTDLKARWGSLDFIYSMGLFDYLIAPVARAVLTKLYDLLEPGGELVIGNFHVGNPTRVYMEYWMDWVLYYRTEEEMLGLAEGLPKSSASIEFETTRSQMFLRVVKNA